MSATGNPVEAGEWRAREVDRHDVDGVAACGPPFEAMRCADISKIHADVLDIKLAV
jgi:hypothetical protein